MIVKVHVALRDEAVDCWRPAAAEELGSGLFRIVGAVPAKPGSIGRVKSSTFAITSSRTEVEAWWP
jgi:hypothetical protein